MNNTKIILFTCCLALSNCSADKGETKYTGDAGSNDAIPEAVVAEQAAAGNGTEVDPKGEEKLLQVTKKIVTIEGEQTSVEVKLKPIVRFATPVALETIFKRVFPASGVRSTTNAYFVANPTQYFTPVEKALLGGFNINAPVGTEVNVDELKNLSLSYTRSVRGFLADACSQLVTAETKKLTTTPMTSKLVRAAGVPTVANLNRFATLLFGYNHPSGTFPQVLTYRKIIADNLSELTTAGFAPTSVEYVEALKGNYILYCVAMCQDPDLYLY